MRDCMQGVGRSARWCAERRDRGPRGPHLRIVEKVSSSNVVAVTFLATHLCTAPHLQEVKLTTTTAKHLRKVCTRAWCAPPPPLLALLFNTNHYYCSNAIVDSPR